MCLLLNGHLIKTANSYPSAIAQGGASYQFLLVSHIIIELDQSAVVVGDAGGHPV